MERGENMKYSYHNHTYRCNHASGEEREYIENAVKAGICEFGFADHVPMPFGGDYYSYFRMKPGEVDGYFYVLENLRREYASDIKIRIGFEAEYYPDVFPKMIDFISEYPYEYLLLGQHALGNEEGDIYCSGVCSDERQLKRYVDQVTDGISTGKFLYLAHPDLFNFDGDVGTYEREMRRLCVFAKNHNVPLEVNVLGLREGRNYPNADFWRIAGEIGCTSIIGADAHTPLDVYDEKNIKRAESIVERFGLEIIDFSELQKSFGK